MTHIVPVEKFQGCLMGLGLGDTLCAANEGGLIERFLWRIIGRTKNGLHRYTDDTQMTIDLAAHLVNNGSINQDVLARDFAINYKWSRGYGPNRAFVLNKIKADIDWRTASTSKYSSGSFGNGAAMRISVVALFFHNRQKELSDAIEQSASITHPNSLAITGAALIAQAVIHGLYDTEPASAIRSMIVGCKSEAFLIRMTFVHECLLVGDIPDPVRLRQTLGTGTSAIDSCPASILIGMYYRLHPIENLLGYVNKCKGDTSIVHQPPRWKMALVTWFGVWPTVYVVSNLARSHVSGWPSFLAAGFVTFLVVLALAWGVMPTLTRLLRPWLLGSADIPRRE